MNAGNIHPKSSKQPRPYTYYAQIYRQSQHNQEDDDDVQIEYQIEKIQAHRLKSQSASKQTAWQLELLHMPLHQIPSSELQFLVKWIGHEERSWQPGQNLKNAPQILESYKKNYHQSKAMSTSKPYTGKPRGRKPKNASGNAGSSGSSKGREFDFCNVFKRKEQDVKGEDDDIQIIDKEDYIKATRQFSRSLVVEPFVKRVPHERNQPIERNQLEMAVEVSGIDMLQPIIQEKVQIVQEQPREYPLSHEPINQEQFPEANNINNQGVNARRLNDRSIMLTQEEKNIDNQQKITKNPLIQIEEQKQRKGDLFEQSLSEGDRLIDLFIETQKKHPHQIEQSRRDQHQSLYWPQNEYFIQDQANHEEVQLQALARLNHQQEKQEQVALPKRAFSQQSHEGLGKILSKKIKQYEAVAQPILKQYGLYQHKDQKAIVIEIEDNGPQQYLPELKASQPLKQLIEKEVNTLLTKGKDNVEEILQIQPQSLPTPTTLKSKQQPCVQCKVHEQYNGQLRLLFTEYIQNNQEINLDNLFLEQETFSVLSTLNPASFNQSNFLRVDKMADITDKEPLCTLISRKIAKRQEVQPILKDFKPSKLIKIRNEWFCILKTDSLGKGRQEHFKYVIASQLIQVSRKTLISFLIN